MGSVKNKGKEEDTDFAYILIDLGTIADPTLEVEYNLQYEVYPDGLIRRIEDEHSTTLFPTYYPDVGKRIIRILENAIRKIKECYNVQD